MTSTSDTAAASTGRVARPQAGPPRKPGGRGAEAEARRHQGPDAGLSPAEARKLLETIHTGTLAGRRDRALLSVMVYSFARVSAVLGIQRQDYVGQGSRGWLSLHEKGRKRHDVPGHHRAAGAFGEYVGAARLEEPKTLFQSVDPSGCRLTGWAFERRVVLAIIKRRAAAAGRPPSTCCHTFRGDRDHGVPVERGHPSSKRSRSRGTRRRRRRSSTAEPRTRSGSTRSSVS